MKFELTLHDEAPTSEVAATWEENDVTLAGDFLAQALARMTSTISEGEERVIGIGVKVTG